MQSEAVRGLVARNVDLTYDMKHQLVKGNLDQLGRSLNTAWSFKRQFDPSISSKYLDKIYDGAMENGASGGKLLGAGGGGYFLFFVTPFMRQKLIKFLNSEGLSVSPVVFDEAGITSWKFEVSSLWRSELMQIENFKIRSGRSLIIAEIGNNHNGNIDIAKSMIDAAQSQARTV